MTAPILTLYLLYWAPVPCAYDPACRPNHLEQPMSGEECNRRAHEIWAADHKMFPACLDACVLNKAHCEVPTS